MKLSGTTITAILAVFSIAIAPLVAGFGGWDDGWSDGWDDGWPDPWDDGTSGGWDGDDTPDTNDGSTDNPTDSGFDDDFDDNWEPTGGFDDPPYWNTLNPQSVAEDSPNGTVVYPNIVKECVNPSTNSVTIKVVSHAPNYNIDFLGDDLVIYNLEPDYYDEGSIVALECGGDAGFFLLTVTPVNDAPEIRGMPNEWQVNFNDILTIDLSQYEYDVDNSGDELSWSASSSTVIFDASVSQKTLTIEPKRVGTAPVSLRLQDNEGLSDSKSVIIKVVTGGYPAPPREERVEKDRPGIFVSSVRIPGWGMARAGDQLESFITLKNSGDFDLEDLLSQMRQIHKMGSLGRLVEMIPGFSKFAPYLPDVEGEKQLKKIEAIILSMTYEERRKPAIIDGKRRSRIARGSGTTSKDVNQLLNQFREIQKLTKSLTQGKLPKKMGTMFDIPQR